MCWLKYDAGDDDIDWSSTEPLNMKPVGPHPVGSFETWVPVEYFPQAFEWFLSNRGALSILVHPLTRYEIKDHTDRVVWMGKSFEIDTSILRYEISNFGSQYPHVGLGYAKSQ